MKVYWEECRRWEVAVAQSGESIHVYLVQDTEGASIRVNDTTKVATAFRKTQDLSLGWGPYTSSYVKPAKLEKALAKAQRECDRKNTAECAANERVHLLAIEEWERNTIYPPGYRKGSDA